MPKSGAGSGSAASGRSRSLASEPAIAYGPKRGPSFKPTYRQQLLAAKAGNDFYADMAGKPRLDDSHIPPAPVPRKPRTEPQRDESDVMRDIGEVLKDSPRVVLAWRQNSGGVDRIMASGETVPVKFWRWIKHPPFPDKYEDGLLLPDILGILADNRWLTIEAKHPNWTKPRDKRERHQAAFLQIVRNHGGVALFATSGAQVAEALR